MEFRPCIDIHNGRVKQIVGGSLKDKGNSAKDNYVSDKDAAWYAAMYKADDIKGAHVILLNSKDSEYFEETKNQALKALSSYPGGLQIGGGINADNAAEFINAGASHVIVTSYVFAEGRVKFENLEKLVAAVGKGKIVLDLSARKREGKFFVVTDRWQTFTEEEVSTDLFDKLSDYCDEFLVHGVDVEGKKAGFDAELIKILADVATKTDMPITYAGGISDMDDIEALKNASDGKLNFTVGSALDLYGGHLKYNILKNIR